MYPSEANASTPRLNTASVFAMRSSASLATTRAGERASLTASLNSDPKFKKYAAQVDKCLQTFDNVHEWADFIAFLAKLLKTFQSFMQFKEIPRKLVVAKRLAQCLNPALPTGVHQRALEVYSHILAVQGTEGLKRDLNLWSAGLFPFFEYAATSVKPTLLNLYDTYYLPLQDALRPVMKAFILALLPGLEEETGEFFDKVLSLLDRLSATVSPAFLLQNIWLVMMITPSARQTSLNFLSRRLPKLSGNEDITPIIGRDVGLMIRAFASALEDDNILVRRATLDLLEQSLPVGSGALKRASKEAQHILMRAASGVVLRRDLSLNRRLFSWLLGPGPEDTQESYFRTHALELLKETLHQDMLATPRPDSRPFKIFISLLDKWEIGGPLVESLLYDAMKGIKRGVLLEEDSGELLITANALYDAVEPLAVWRQLFNAVHLELLSKEANPSLEAISLVNFVLTRLRAQEEEVQNVHLPIFFVGISDFLRDKLSHNPTYASSKSLYEVLQLLSEVAKHIPTSAWRRSIFQDPDQPTTGSLKGPYARACEFYKVPIEGEDGTLQQSSSRSLIPLVTAVEDLISLSDSLGKTVSKEEKQQQHDERRRVLDTFMVMLNLLSDLVDATGGHELVISWDPVRWQTAILSTLESRSSFSVTNIVISTILALGKADLQASLIYDDRKTMSNMVYTLLHYLRPEYAPYHVRAVHLLWVLEHATSHHHVESLIAQSLASPESWNVSEAYEAFGVLWRLTDDAFVPGFQLKLPMLMVLDTLKHQDIVLRRIGETWMRCSLKSYTRVLEPLLHDLLDPSILRSSNVSIYNDREVTGLSYQRRFDQERMKHILDTLLGFSKFGGQGFSRVARSTLYRKSPYSGFVERIESSNIVSSDASYLDVLLEVLLVYLRSEPQTHLASLMEHTNAQIQAVTIDLLQTIITRGDLDAPRLETVQVVVIAKLYAMVHEGTIDLQNKLLHLLHSILSSLSSSMAPQYSGSALNRSTENIDSAAEKALVADDGRRHASSSFIPINPLLLPTLIDGIIRSMGHPTLQHWLDFLLMSVPQFPRMLSYTVPPLSDCICRQLTFALADVGRLMGKGSSAAGTLKSNTTDAEFIMLLNALERLILLGLSKNYDPALVDKEEEVVPERPVQQDSGGSGLLGIVSNVFGSESTGNVAEEPLSSRSPGYRALHDSVRVLHSLWVITGQTARVTTLPESDSLSLIFARARARGRKVLERFFRAQSSEVLESVVECWNMATQEGSDPAVAFEIVDALTSSAQTVVHMLCESISSRISPSDKTKRGVTNPNLSEGVLFSFLEGYLCRLEGPLAVQVWGRCVALAKEVTSNVTAYRMQLYPTLRCINVLADKVTQTTATDDRRTKKDLQDIYTKLVDNCILIAGRSFDQGTWIRRTTALPVNGRSSPMPPDPNTEEKNSAAQSIEASVTSLGLDLPEQVNTYLAASVLPNLRRYLFDNDKVAGVCTNVVYYIVTPATKSKARSLDFDDYILDTLRELSRIPAGARAWRPPILDAYNDNRFFNSTPEASQKWRPIIRAFLDSDRQALLEIIAKVTATGSSNIFANREYENLLRSLNLRRLSYAIFTGEKNQFLTQLPSIQEKLVDVLRNNNPALVESEVYLCLRVLLCRLSPHNLSSFWPVILTELLRIFEDISVDPPADGPENLHVVLSASKLIDLLLTLQTEEFQIHQWMFITDTVDAVYHPDSWIPAALLDQLAEIISDLPAPPSTTESAPVSAETPSRDDGKLDTALTYDDDPSSPPMRRPLLTHVRQIQNIRDLVPFFSQVSIASYEGVYHSHGNVDWNAVERSLLEEMFEGG